MRTRFLAGIVVTLLGLIVLVVPGPASAAPQFNRGLTIAASPNPITAGEGVMVYGKLRGHDVAYREIMLYHRIAPASHFSLVSVTRTNADGFYKFVRADGIVNTNRDWFVVGPGLTHSHTMHERVASVLTLTTAATTATAGQAVSFSGTVTPAHAYQRVYLQEQTGTSGNGWEMIASTRTNASSSFTLAHRFADAGSYTLRALFPADPRNLAGESSLLTLTVQPGQTNPSFTINGSAATLTAGQSETISGTLYTSGSTTAPAANVPVMLYGAQSGSASFHAIAITTTDSSGDYSFTRSPDHNVVYRVATTTSPQQQSGEFDVSVQDDLTVGLSATTTTAGTAVTISGAVAPEHSGHVIYLQEESSSGVWANVATGTVDNGSLYSFSYKPGSTGALQLRVQIPSGSANAGGTSATVSLTVDS